MKRETKDKFIEFMMIYGWAILVLLVAIGALAYYKWEGFL